MAASFFFTDFRYMVLSYWQNLKNVFIKNEKNSKETLYFLYVFVYDSDCIFENVHRRNKL